MSIETLTQTEGEQEASAAPIEPLEVEAKEEQVEETETEETEEAVSEDGAEEESEEVEQPKPKKIGGYKAKLLKERARAEYLEQRLRELETKAPVKTDVALEKPDPTKFENQADYLEALTDYKVAKIKKDLESEKAKEGQEQSQKVALSTYENRSKEFAKVQPDYTEKIEEFDDENPGFQWTSAMSRLIVESEVGPAVLYEMAKDHDLAHKLNSLDPLSAAKEFGKLEAKLSKPKQQIKKSAAPPPVKPISGTKTESVKNIYDPNMPFDEWEKAMDELERKNRKRA